jgi:hypothetical protein
VFLSDTKIGKDLMMRILTTAALILGIAVGAANAEEENFSESCYPTGAFSLMFPDGADEESSRENESLGKLMQERLVTLRFNRGLGSSFGQGHYGVHPAAMTTGNTFIDSLWHGVRGASFTGVAFKHLWAEYGRGPVPEGVDAETVAYIKSDIKRLEAAGVDPRNALRVVSYDLRMRHLQGFYKKLDLVHRTEANFNKFAARMLDFGVAFGPAYKLCRMDERELIADAEVMILRLMPQYNTPEYRHMYFPPTADDLARRYPRPDASKS